ncbi:MAG: hypothetical protein QM762_14980 [Chryseolinea sp.]
MKNICLWIALLLLSHSGHAEIRNGYADEITGAWSSLQHLTNLLQQQFLTAAERKKLEDGIRKTTDQIVYYELTQQLLAEFRFVSPDLYNEIDTLKDYKGRSAIIYVKFVPDENSRGTSHGMTCITRMTDAGDVKSQETGISLLIEVRIMRKALVVLAHEFGHVRYVLPHLSTYLQYYERTYWQLTSDPDFAGHDENDVSGKSAEEYAKRYRESRFQHWRNDHNKSASPIALTNNIRKQFTPNAVVASSVITGLH